MKSYSKTNNYLLYLNASIPSFLNRPITNSNKVDLYAQMITIRKLLIKQTYFTYK